MKIIGKKPGIMQYSQYTLHEMILSNENLSKWFSQLCAGIQPDVVVDEELLAMMEGHGLVRMIDHEWSLGYEGREFARKLGLKGDMPQIQIRHDIDREKNRQYLDISHIWEQFQVSHDDISRNKLMEYYTYLVRHSAQRLHAKLPDKVELDDLISAGMFGLMDAIDAYNPTRGVKFETYCVPRIRGSILDELRSMDWVPRLARTRSRLYKNTIENLNMLLGRKPTEEEIAKELEIDKYELHQFQKDAQVVNLVPLSANSEETQNYEEICEIDVILSLRSENPLVEAQKRDLEKFLTKGLTRAERLIIVLYYYSEMTMKEIGATLDLSESRVSQMHSSIVARLRAKFVGKRKEFSLLIHEAEKDKRFPE